MFILSLLFSFNLGRLWKVGFQTAVSQLIPSCIISTWNSTWHKIDIQSIVESIAENPLRSGTEVRVALRQGVFQQLWAGRIEGETGSAAHSAGYLQGQESLDSLPSKHWVLFFLLSRNKTNQLLLQRLRYPELMSNDGVLRRNLISIGGFCYISCSF